MSVEASALQAFFQITAVGWTVLSLPQPLNYSYDNENGQHSQTR
jgi:hypothetical protein